MTAARTQTLKKSWNQ